MDSTLCISAFGILLLEYLGHPNLYRLQFVCSYLFQLKKRFLNILKLLPTKESVKDSEK